MNHRIYSLSIIAVLFVTLLKPIECVHRSEILDSEGKFRVTWEVLEASKEIIFNVTVQTTGFVGFGISTIGRMTGADIVIGGVNTDGSSYFQDRYAEGNGMPLIDEHQDWKLLQFSENKSFTSLRFSRPIISCDMQDVSITKGVQRFIWAFGKDDNIKYHKANRGSFVVNILDPPTPEIDLTKYESFDAIMNVTLPPRKTTYWCTVHQSPLLTRKYHAIALGPKFLDSISQQHSHHLSFYRCKAPKGKNPGEFFEPFISAGGKDCFEGGSDRNLEIFKYCSAPIYSWAMGARKMHMPKEVGLPIGEKGREYYLLEIHFDNPTSQPDITVQSGIEIHYTSQIRPTEAAVLTIGGVSDWKLVIPPSTSNFMVAGHCSSSCTSFLRPEGLNIFNVQLHAHSSAKEMRLRQFRKGTELPWISDEPMYENSFQDNRNIQPVKLLPGDHLTLECTYDNTWIKPPTSVIGGYSTKEEMCASVIYYYPRTEFTLCASENDPRRLLHILGIKQISSLREANPTIMAPPELVDKKFKDYLDTLVNWTDALRESIQNEYTVGPQFGDCENENLNTETLTELSIKNLSSVTYPKIDKAYEPFDECDKRSSSSGSSLVHFSFIKIENFLFMAIGMIATLI